MEDYKTGYAATIAPLVVKDKVIVGVAGGEYGCRGFIDAYDAQTGKRAWRFYTIPGPGEPGNETWAGDSWKRGGASIWVTGAYDPELNLAYFGTGNPGPDYHSDSRKGDNLYSDSLVALDVDTGKLRWHYQFTPHDVHDWDATQVPILARPDHQRPAAQGRDVRQPQRLLLHARSHDRQAHRREAVRARRRGRRRSAATAGRFCCRATRRTKRASSRVPDITGGTNFWPPSFDPRQRLFFVNAREVVHDLLRVEARIRAGRAVHGRRRPAREGPDMPAYGALRAIDPTTGERKWEFKYLNPVDRRSADHRVGPDLQRRQRRQPARARLAQRKAALALSDGRDAARHVADHLHGRRPAAPARAGGHDADGVGAAGCRARDDHEGLSDPHLKAGDSGSTEVDCPVAEYGRTRDGGNEYAKCSEKSAPGSNLQPFGSGSVLRGCCGGFAAGISH